MEEHFTFRALVWYLTAFLVCSFATVTWSTDLVTFCSMLFTMSPWKKEQQPSKRAQPFTSRNTGTHRLLLINETSMLRQTLTSQDIECFLRDANNDTKSRTTPLPQAGLPLRKHGASSNKNVVRLREDQCTCVGCNVKCSVVSAVRPHSNILLKCIQVGSTETEWWDGRSGRRDEKEALRKKWSWKRGDRHKCRSGWRRRRE